MNIHDNISPVRIAATIILLLSVSRPCSGLQLFAALLPDGRSTQATKNHTFEINENFPPEIAIVFPTQNVLMEPYTPFPIRVKTTDADGTIQEVQFYSNTNLIGIVTSAPFTLQWEMKPVGDWNSTEILTAIAVDNLGATNVSMPVTIHSIQPQNLQPFFSITSPRNFAILPAMISFEYSALLGGTDGSANPALFFIGTNLSNLNLVGMAIDPPYSITVSNLSEGTHVLLVGSTNRNGTLSLLPQLNHQIQIVSALLSEPQKKSDGYLAFKAAGRLAGGPVVVESSQDFLRWQPVATNVLSTSSFLFQEAIELTRFYRLRLPP